VRPHFVEHLNRRRVLRRCLAALNLLVEREHAAVDARDHGVQVEEPALRPLGLADALRHVVSPPGLPDRRSEATDDRRSGTYQGLRE
jgi:hypothetical protein